MNYFDKYATDQPTMSFLESARKKRSVGQAVWWGIFLAALVLLITLSTLLVSAVGTILLPMLGISLAEMMDVPASAPVSHAMVSWLIPVGFFSVLAAMATKWLLGQMWERFCRAMGRMRTETGLVVAGEPADEDREVASSVPAPEITRAKHIKHVKKSPKKRSGRASAVAVKE